MHLECPFVQVGSVLLTLNILSCETWWAPEWTQGLGTGCEVYKGVLLAKLFICSCGALLCQWEMVFSSGGWAQLERPEIVFQVSEGLEIRRSLLLVNYWCWVSKLHWKEVKWRKKRTIILQMGFPLSFFWCFFSQQIKMQPKWNLNAG